jgi:carbamoylphosphate synthase small subunit
VRSYVTTTTLQKNPIGTNDANNEFGNTGETGLYTFNFDITDPSYEGQLLVGFLIGHFE